MSRGEFFNFAVSVACIVLFFYMVKRFDQGRFLGLDRGKFWGLKAWTLFVLAFYASLLWIDVFGNVALNP